MKRLKKALNRFRKVSCRNCGEEFETAIATKFYCNASCKAMYMKPMRAHKCVHCSISHPSVTKDKEVCVPCLLYAQINIEKRELRSIVDWLRNQSICFYCGEYGSEIEHVVPRVTALPTWTVQACGECNKIASGTLFDSVLEKLNFIKEKRRGKYHRVLSEPEWTDDELSELGKNLRSSIAATQRARLVVLSQLEWNPLAVREPVA